MVEKLEAERSSKTLPMGSGKMVRMGECEKEINTWQSLTTVDNHIWARGKEQERESSNAEMERDKREMVHRVYMAAVKEKNGTGS